MYQIMKILRQLSISFLCALAIFYASGCNESLADVRADEQVYVPIKPDYSDALMWTVLKNDVDGTGADVF